MPNDHDWYKQNIILIGKENGTIGTTDSSSSASVTIDTQTADGKQTMLNGKFPIYIDKDNPQITATFQDGYAFQGWHDGETHVGSAGGSYKVELNITLTAVWCAVYTAPNPYAVVIDDTTHGTVNVAPNRAAEGKTVTLEVIPDQGYVLKSLTVTDADGKSLKLTQVSDSRYTFEMPGSAVTVKAVFAPKGLPFTDVSGHWALDAITYVYEHGMMNGISTTKFGPDVDLTRGMLVTILYRLENEPAAGSCPFSDVAKNAYYADPIAWAAAHEIVTGYSETSFGPNDPLTREQLATILYRYAQYKGYDVSVGEDTNILSYKDFDEIHTYAVPAMQWACGAGILQGSSGMLHPTATATRAQVATILMRFCEQ